MLKKLFFILIAVILSAALGGCYDYKEVDDVAFIISLGIDEGKTSKLELTYLYPNYKEQSGDMSGSGSSGGGSDGYTIQSFETPNFYTGMDAIQGSISRRVNFSHVNVVVISQRIAERGQLGDYVTPLIRDTDIRRDVRIIISKCPAKDFIEANKLIVGTSFSKSIDATIENISETGYSPFIDLYDFYQGIKSPYKQAAAMLGDTNRLDGTAETEKAGKGIKTSGEYTAGEMPREGGKKHEHLGSAIFDGDKMVGELNGDESRLMLIAKGDFKRSYFVIKDPNKSGLDVTVSASQTQRKVKVRFEGDKPVIHLQVGLEGDIKSIESGLDYENPDFLPLLEKAYATEIKSRLDMLMEKCKALNCDIFAFGGAAVMDNLKKFPTINSWEEYNWHKHFKEAVITTDVDFSIETTGTMLKSSDIISSEGKK